MKSKFEKYYVRYFVIAICVLLSPLVPLFYIIPVFGLFYLALFSGFTGKTYIKAFLITFTFLFAGVLYSTLTDYFKILPYSLFFITYGSVFFAFLVPTSRLSSNQVYFKMINILIIMIAVQGIVGLGQYAYGVLSTGRIGNITGDWVEGTMGILNGPGGGETKPFCATMTIALVLTFPTVFKSKRHWIKYWVLGAIAVILASTIHQIIFLIVAVAISGVLLFKNLLSKYYKYLAIAFFVFGIFAIASYQLNTTSFSTLTPKLERVQEGKNPKFIFMSRLIFTAPDKYPGSLVFGFGPGQLSSLANLIGTEMYYGSPANPKDIPLLEGVRTDPFNEYYFDLWYKTIVTETFRGGSTHNPFSSWMSLFAEFGLLGVFLVSGFIIRVIYVVIVSNSDTLIRFSFLSAFLFIVFIAFQLNYWELPQAIFIGVMMMKVVHSKIISNK